MGCIHHEETIMVQNDRIKIKTTKIDGRRKSTQFIDHITENVTVIPDVLTQDQRLKVK